MGASSKTYLIQYRNADGASRRLAIGKHPQYLDRIAAAQVQYDKKTNAL